MTDTPSEATAEAIATAFSGHKPQRIQRFDTGIAHWVYDVQSGNGDNIVVKIGTQDQHDDITGAIAWTDALLPLGIPLPPVLSSGVLLGFPFLIMPRLPGSDLGTVYPTLTRPQKLSLAAEICRVQRLVHAFHLAVRCRDSQQRSRRCGVSSWRSGVRLPKWGQPVRC